MKLISRGVLSVFFLQEKPVLFFADGYLELVHHRKHVLPDLTFLGKRLIVLKVGRMKGGH